MADRASTQAKLYAQIEASLADEERPYALLQLAEAFAWVSNPNQAHGGGASTSPN
jgi:hypothetical protein